MTTKNIPVGRYTVRPQCGPDECPLYGACQTPEGRLVIASQIGDAVLRNNPAKLPTAVLAGKGLAERPAEGGVCLHLGRLIGATQDATTIVSNERELEWAVEHGFGTYASINQPRE